mmetsp:Transcript_16272/g.23709  ORF Transcript_16272/g.23709 Transcript_16272/m.23709 type:complete len:119 (-) Transcript_16272:51-407(-)
MYWTLFVDVAWATHWDRKSHTGGVVTVGSKRRVPILWKSGKQKVVAASSTEAELIGLSDYLDLVLLVRSYLEFLGRPSLHSRRRFVDIRYFWFKQFLLASVRSGDAFKGPRDALLGHP